MTPTQVNQIIFVETIGSGGTASIYKGIDTNTGFPVAVKVLWNNLFKNKAMKARFLQEANHYLYLDHPRIVDLKDFIQKDDASYLVMEYIEGRNLEEYIDQTSGPIPQKKAILMMRDILEGIDYAHRQNVLHLDIKPSNIMITQDEQCKVIDFGISSKMTEANTGVVMGSPLYMSPEQTEGNNMDERSDIYSLGITFFKMLTGQTPLSAATTRTELFEKIRTGQLGRAKDFYPFVSDAMQDIIDMATKVDKEERFQTAAEFAAALNVELK